jgi:hypothetical protein
VPSLFSSGLVAVVRQQVLAGRLRARQQLVAGAEEVVLLAARVVLLVVEALDGLLVVRVDAGLPELRHVGAGSRDVVGLGERLGLRGALHSVEQARQRLVGWAVVERLLPQLLAVGADHVRLPVVELQLRRGADLLLGAGGILHARQADVDLVGALLLDLGLRDTERVGALADRVDRVRYGLRCDLRDLRRWLRLVDQLDAAAQVQAQLRLLGERGARDDREQRQRDEEPDDRQDDQVAAAIVHQLGVSTSKSPPSSS